MEWWLALVALTLVGGAASQTVTVENEQTVSANTGDTIALTFRVQNLGSKTLNWIFLKQKLTIFHGDQALTKNSKYSLVHAPGSELYSLQISGVGWAQQGVYMCEMDGTNIGATIELIVTDSPIPPEVEYAPDTPMNHTDCCIQQGVSSPCLPICGPSAADLNPISFVACGAEVGKIVFCGSDGRNHENCCARSGVPSSCLMVCSNDPLKMPSVSPTCLAHAQTILSCYQYGAVLLPSPPESVSVTSSSRNNIHTLLVSWKEPTYNPTAVTGYIVYIKKSTEAKFTANTMLDGSVKESLMEVVENAVYSVYVVAVGHHGSSQPSQTVTITILDTTVPIEASEIGHCCQLRHVSAECERLLCHPQVWKSFSVNDMVQCYAFLPDVFACLAGERNHQACCETNNVDAQCIGMCSGSPPIFNQTLFTCVPELPFIEACVQRGLVSQPGPPKGLFLGTVTSHSVVLQWSLPSATGITPPDSYYVQLRRGNDSAEWHTVDNVVGTSVLISNLTESETYALRVFSQLGNTSSLPSAQIQFKTFPETMPPMRPTVTHNLTECCEDSLMPSICSEKCIYSPYMTASFYPIIDTCGPFIGTVLTCAADGRDHTACCIQRGVSEPCRSMCVMNSPGPIGPSLIQCINDTALVLQCYEEGLEGLVRMPEDLSVETSGRTLTATWRNPETGPTPTEYEASLKQDGPIAADKRRTTDHVMIYQNLDGGARYTFTVTSFLNSSSSPPTAEVTVFIPYINASSPSVPSLPDSTKRALWNNRTHCCESSGISEACQPLCLNQPTTATNCTNDKLKILSCSADGKDHSACCRSQGLVEECVSLCSGHAVSEIPVRQVGCLAENSLTIITSCFLDQTGLMPSAPKGFMVHSGYSNVATVSLEWTGADNCDADCHFDVHYWKTYTSDPSAYTTVLNVTSPHVLRDLKLGAKFTFTVTARNDKGSGPSAPWQSLYFGILRPDISISAQPDVDDSVFNQGDNVLLTCRIFNVQHSVSYMWALRGHNVGSRVMMLALNNVTRRSEGNYSCTVTLSDFNATAFKYVSVRYQPQLVSHSVESARPDVGSQAVLEFDYRGHPDITDLTSVFSKDGASIQQSNRHSLSARADPLTGITTFKLKISDVVQSDYGMYQCRVMNQYGSAAVFSLKLSDPDTLPTPIPPSPEQQRNVSGCCRERGVIDTCMPLCTMEVSVQEALDNPSRFGVCLTFFNDFVECAADGGDHTMCCEEEVVSEACLPLCKGKVPPTDNIFDAPHLLECVPHTPNILTCMETGFDKIPTAPLGVNATLQDDKIRVMWGRPTRNADKVTTYTIYFNYTGHGHYKSEIVSSAVGLSHVLGEGKEGVTYNIWMTAENQHVGRSQVSNMVTVPIPFPHTDDEGLPGGAIAGIVIGVLALVAIIIVVVVLVRRQGAGNHKLMETVGFENGYDNPGLKIGGLPSNDPYAKF